MDPPHSQRSWQVVAGFDQNFHMGDRPFRFTTEAYYKSMTRVDPYDINNVNIQYFALNDAKAYATGMEFRYESYALTRPLYHGLNCLPLPGVGGCPASPTNLLTPEGYTVVSNNNDFIQASATGDVEGDRVVGAAFAETVIPVFTAQNALPGLRQLDFSAAVRYEPKS